MKFDIDFKGIDVNNPPKWGQKLLLIGVIKDYRVSEYRYTPAILLGELRAIKKDSLEFKCDDFRFVAQKYAVITDYQEEMYNSIVNYQKDKDADV